MADRPATELYYFSFHAKDWLSSRSVRRMSREERGDFIDLLALAWGNGIAEPSLEADDFGPASNRVRAQFQERNGRLYNEKLSSVWRECQVRHTQAVKRGKASGKARRDRKRLETVSKPSRNQVEQPPLDLVLRGEKDPLGSTAGSLALTSASPPTAPVENGDRDVRRGGGFTRLTDLLPAALRPKPA